MAFWPWGGVRAQALETLFNNSHYDLAAMAILAQGRSACRQVTSFIVQPPRGSCRELKTLENKHHSNHIGMFTGILLCKVILKKAGFQKEMQ